MLFPLLWLKQSFDEKQGKVKISYTCNETKINRVLFFSKRYCKVKTLHLISSFVILSLISYKEKSSKTERKELRTYFCAIYSPNENQSDSNSKLK